MEIGREVGSRSTVYLTLRVNKTPYNLVLSVPLQVLY